MKNFPKLLATGSLAIATASAAAFFVPQADAATFSGGFSLLLTETNFPEPGDPSTTITSNFTKFNSTGKTLNAVRAYLEGTLTGTIQFQNNSTGTRKVTSYTQNGALSVNAPGGLLSLVEVLPTQNIITGTSPLTIKKKTSSPVYSFNPSVGSLTGPGTSIASGNWGLFAANGGGAGSFEWGGSASYTANIDNNVNLFSTANFTGNFRFEIDYADNLPSPSQVIPEPSTLLGLGFVAALGFFGRKKKSNG